MTHENPEAPPPHGSAVNPTPDPPRPVPPTSAADDDYIVHATPPAELGPGTATAPPPVISDGLTKEMSDANAKAIYPQTVHRISTLMQTLIQLTGNGDLAIWAVIEALGSTIRGLNFAAVPPLSRQQFLGLLELALKAYIERAENYRRAWEDYEVAFDLTTKAGTIAPDMPEFPAWTDADALAIYDQMDALYGPPKDEATK